MSNRRKTRETKTNPRNTRPRCEYHPKRFSVTSIVNKSTHEVVMHICEECRASLTKSG